jgi:hypothetical protein
LARGSVLPLTFGTVQSPVVLRSTETVSLSGFAVARSNLRSSSRSPIATEIFSAAVR